MKTSSVISAESQEEFWSVVRRCLHHFHRATPPIYSKLRELRAKIDDSPIEEIELFFHSEPFDVACGVARNKIAVELVLDRYLVIRDGESTS